MHRARGDGTLRTPLRGAASEPRFRDRIEAIRWQPAHDGESAREQELRVYPPECTLLIRMRFESALLRRVGER
jgi:hypothetical protein